MRKRIERLREDVFTFNFDEDERFVIDAGNDYPAIVTSVRARFTPEGQLLSVEPRGKKIKKDGTPSVASANFKFYFHDLDHQAKYWRELALLEEQTDAERSGTDPR